MTISEDHELFRQLARLDRMQLWELLSRLAATQAEQVVLYDRYVLDLAPRVIQARHPALFGDLNAVVTAIYSLHNRLRRDGLLLANCSKGDSG